MLESAGRLLNFTANGGSWGIRAADGKLMFRYDTGGEWNGQLCDTGLCRQQGLLQFCLWDWRSAAQTAG
jgi:hypothetical protein